MMLGKRRALADEEAEEAAFLTTHTTSSPLAPIHKSTSTRVRARIFPHHHHCKGTSNHPLSWMSEGSHACCIFISAIQHILEMCFIWDHCQPDPRYACHSCCRWKKGCEHASHHKRGQLASQPPPPPPSTVPLSPTTTPARGCSFTHAKTHALSPASPLCQSCLLSDNTTNPILRK